MKKIPLTKGMFALVDDEDYERLSVYKWHVNTISTTIYASRYFFGNKKLFLQRAILNNYNPNILIDHIDHNGLNNQKSNLRICSVSQNAMNNRKRKNTTSIYKGVSWRPHYGTWRCLVQKHKKVLYEKNFHREIDAAIAYDREAQKLFGEFACLNFK